MQSFKVATESDYIIYKENDQVSKRYKLSSQEAGRLRRSVEPHAQAAFNEEKFLEVWKLAQQVCVLPDVLKSQVAGFACSQTEPGLFLIQNLPLDPVHKNLKHTSITEFVMLAISALLGTPYGYATQRGGAVIQNFWPKPEHASLQLGTSDAELIWHTEDSFLDYTPDFIALLCLRGDPDAVTRVSSINPAELDEGMLEALSQPWYSIHRDASYGEAAEQNGRIAPIISWVDGQICVRYEPVFISFLCEEAKLAHARLTEYIENHSEGVALRPGEMLLIDNRRAVHARTAINPRYDGTDRWVQRVAIWQKSLPQELFDRERPQVILI